jgi:hypothetical protein
MNEEEIREKLAARGNHLPANLLLRPQPPKATRTEEKS